MVLVPIVWTAKPFTFKIPLTTELTGALYPTERHIPVSGLVKSVRIYQVTPARQEGFIFSRPIKHVNQTADKPAALPSCHSKGLKAGSEDDGQVIKDWKKTLLHSASAKQKNFVANFYKVFNAKTIS